MTSSRYMLLGFVLIIFLVISEIIADITFAKKVQNDIAVIVETHSVKIRLVHKLLGLTHDRISTLNQMLIEPDSFIIEDLYNSFLGDANRYIKTRSELIKLITTDEEKTLLDELRQIAVNGTPIVEQAVELARSEKSNEAIQLVLTQILPIQTQMYKKTQQIINYYQNDVALQANITHSSSKKWLDGVALLGGGIVFFILAIAWYVSRRTVKDKGSLVNEIHERKRVEQQLELSRDNLEKTVQERTEQLQKRTIQLNQAQHIAHLGHWEWEIASGKLFWSDEIFRIFGVNKESFEPSYQAFVETIHPNDRERVLLSIHDTLSSENDYEVSHRIIRPNGEERYVQEKGVVTRDENNTPLNMLGTIQDISEEKALHDRLVLISSVFHSTGEGVMIADANNKILEINSAFSDFLGYELDDIYLENPNILRSSHHNEAFYKQMWDSLNSEDQWQGEIWDRHKNGKVIPLLMTINVVKDKQGQLLNYVALFRDISDIKETEQHLWHIAHHDPLTQMPNRSLMYAQLEQAIKDAHRDKQQVAVLLIDLDGFKQVNDSLGHEAGDFVLQQVSNLLLNSIRKNDTAARYAGDEFVIILKKQTNSEAAQQLASKLNQLISSPLSYANQTIQVGASIGIAFYPQHGEDTETLIAQADSAMYKAKQQGKNSFVLYES